MWNIPVPFANRDPNQPFANLSRNAHNDGSTQNLNIPTFVKDNIKPLFVVLGDFNLHLCKPLDDKIPWIKPQARSDIGLILKALEVTIIPSTMSSTTFSGTRGNSTIDYLCIPKTWMLRLQDFKPIETSRSDHVLLFAHVLSPNSVYHSPPYWRFKNLLLSDKLFTEEMTNLITKDLSNCPQEPALLPQFWDSFKLKCCSFAKAFWQQHKQRISTDNKSYWSGISPQEILFLRCPRTGAVVNSHSDISRILTSYYKDLYTSDTNTLIPPDNMTFGLHKISDELVTPLSESLQLSELEKALANMKPNKAPGYDGLTTEFYSRFWPLVGPFLLQWANQILAQGHLSGTASIGVITLIPKSGDLRDISNWRPITLMAVDSKIILKAMANRLKPAINSIIPLYQTAVPGRSIHQSLAIIRDYISLQKEYKTPVYLLSLDQRKAYDRVSHTFLFHLLYIIGLPESFIGAIKTFYTGFKCCIKNVSYLSPTFPYNRGVRQGDPLATLLYVLALQPALNMINLMLQQEHSHSPNTNTRLTAFADDVTCFIDHPDTSNLVIESFQEVAKYSEAALNLKKSSITFFGSNKEVLQRWQSTNGIQIFDGQVKILGIVFSSDGNIHPSQWEKALTSTKETTAGAINTLNKLSYYERADWVARKLWPRWAYILKTLQPSLFQINQLTSIFSEVIWLGSKHWLPTTVLSDTIHNGGLNLISVTNKIDTFRVQFVVKCIASGPDSDTFKLAETIFNLYNKANIGFRVLHTTIDADRCTDLPVFYRAIHIAWNKLNTTFFPSSEVTLLNLPSFNSKPLHDSNIAYGLSAAQAFTMKSFTIKQFLSYIPKKQTRAHDNLKASISQTVQEWQPAMAPPCNCEHITDDMEITPTDDTRAPTFYLHNGESYTHSCNWNNKLIHRHLCQQTETNNSHISKEVWTTLVCSIAPAVFRNRFWRFLHGRLATSAFFYKIGTMVRPTCALCNQEDISTVHQFQNCTQLQPSLQMLRDDISSLGHQTNNLPFGLYVERQTSTLIANFLIMAFVYTILEVIKQGVNGTAHISQSRIKDTFHYVITKHIYIQSILHPPNLEENKKIWSALSYAHLLVKPITNDKLLVRSKDGFFISR